MKIKTIILFCILFSLVACGGSGSPDQTDKVNTPPTVDAGQDISTQPTETVTLEGNALDSDGTITSYNWTQLEGPSVALNDSNKKDAYFVAPTLTNSAVLIFRLTVLDNDNASSYDDISVTVSPVEQNVAKIELLSTQIVLTDSEQEIDLAPIVTDFNGNIIERNLNWHVAKEGVININDEAKVKALSPFDITEIYASYGDIVSNTIVVSTALLNSNVVNLNDDDIIATTQNQNQADSQTFQVELTNLAGAQQNSILTYLGNSAFAGKVESIENSAMGYLVTLSAVNLDDIFEDMPFNLSATLTVDENQLSKSYGKAYSINKTENGFNFTLKNEYDRVQTDELNKYKIVHKATGEEASAITGWVCTSSTYGSVAVDFGSDFTLPVPEIDLRIFRNIDSNVIGMSIDANYSSDITTYLNLSSEIQGSFNCEYDMATYRLRWLERAHPIFRLIRPQIDPEINIAGEASLAQNLELRSSLGVEGSLSASVKCENTCSFSSSKNPSSTFFLQPTVIPSAKLAIDLNASLEIDVEVNPIFIGSYELMEIILYSENELKLRDLTSQLSELPAVEDADNNLFSLEMGLQIESGEDVTSALRFIGFEIQENIELFATAFFDGKSLESKGFENIANDTEAFDFQLSFDHNRSLSPFVNEQINPSQGKSIAFYVGEQGNDIPSNYSLISVDNVQYNYNANEKISSYSGSITKESLLGLGDTLYAVYTPPFMSNFGELGKFALDALPLCLENYLLGQHPLMSERSAVFLHTDASFFSDKVELTDLETHSIHNSGIVQKGPIGLYWFSVIINKDEDNQQIGWLLPEDFYLDNESCESYSHIAVHPAVGASTIIATPPATVSNSDPLCVIAAGAGINLTNSPVFTNDLGIKWREVTVETGHCKGTQGWIESSLINEVIEF